MHVTLLVLAMRSLMMLPLEMMKPRVNSARRRQNDSESAEPRRRRIRERTQRRRSGDKCGHNKGVNLHLSTSQLKGTELPIVTAICCTPHNCPQSNLACTTMSEMQLLLLIRSSHCLRMQKPNVKSVRRRRLNDSEHPEPTRRRIRGRRRSRRSGRQSQGANRPHGRQSQGASRPHGRQSQGASRPYGQRRRRQSQGANRPRYQRSRRHSQGANRPCDQRSRSWSQRVASACHRGHHRT